jgi:hypothetical protein
VLNLMNIGLTEIEPKAFKYGNRLKENKNCWRFFNNFSSSLESKRQSPSWCQQLDTIRLFRL